MTTAPAAPEALFYHLEHQPLDQVLPALVERTLERGWRAVIQAGSKQRVEALDSLLWTYRADGFLPHGTVADGHAARQPIFLTEGDDAPNQANVRFLVDGAAPAAFTGHARYVFLFDGRDPDAVQGARLQWKAARAAGCATTYWQQSADGRWEKKAG
jgi:DNA polymerase-3 subunit chi